MVQKCRNCGGTEFVRDHSTASGDLACKNCGTVSEENPIVSEVSFVETSSGAAAVQGSFIGPDQAGARFAGPYGSGKGTGIESREQTLANAKRRIRSVAAALKIPDYITEAANQWYHIALTNNFVQGRRSQNVIATCLYIACRKEKTHHMLIDFSSRLQISVYSVGATFLKMCKALHINNLPLADPSLFIQHFAERLDFGSDRIKIINDAVKLAQKMSAEWLQEGRRPAGIAGACLLLAARMNNHRRTKAEIVHVAHVAEETIQRRLNEFRGTASATQSLTAFRADARTKVPGAVPPAFRKHRRQEKMEAELRQAGLSEQEIRRAASKRDFVQDPVVSVVGDEVVLDDTTIAQNHVLRALLSDRSFTDKELSEDVRIITEKLSKRFRSSGASGGVAGESGDSGEVAEGGESGVARDTGGTDRGILKKPRPVDRNKPRNLHQLPKTADILAKVNSDPENLSDVDDEEIQTFFLDDEAKKFREIVWHNENKDYLIEQERKKLKLGTDEFGNPLPAVTKPKRKSRKDKQNQVKSTTRHIAGLGMVGNRSNFGSRKSETKVSFDLPGDSGNSGAAADEPGSAAESAKNMMQKRSFSRKINYSAIDDIFKTT